MQAASGVAGGLTLDFAVNLVLADHTADMTGGVRAAVESHCGADWQAPVCHCDEDLGGWGLSSRQDWESIDRTTLSSGQTEGLGGQVLTSYTAKNIDVVFAFFIPLRFYRFWHVSTNLTQ